MSDNESNESKAAQKLVTEVAERITNSGSVVRERLIEKMTEKELSSRVNLLDSAFQKQKQLAGELKKVNRPDNVALDVNGKEVSGTYTRERLKAIKKAKEQLQKLENAMERALENDFGKLRELNP